MANVRSCSHILENDTNDQFIKFVNVWYLSAENRSFKELIYDKGYRRVCHMGHTHIHNLYKRLK